ncbi:MAG: 50S ribosomal protein L23 [Myxococcota bacterium]|nr:50S ribosomal protein L23 [Myxococcota bacterium]
MSDSIYTVLKRPVNTEKTRDAHDVSNQYVFEVLPSANKIQIRQAVEEIFGVRVTDVRTINVRGKTRRFRRGIGKKPNWKKAIVTLRDGDIIDVFEGV